MILNIKYLYSVVSIYLPSKQASISAVSQIRRGNGNNFGTIVHIAP